MKKIGRPWFFVVLIVIAALTYLTVFGWHTPDGNTVIRGVSEIRWGMDVSGGVSVTFGPDGRESEEINEDDVSRAAEIIAQRLEEYGVSSHQIYTDTHNMRVIVWFPWGNGDHMNNEELISAISAEAQMFIVEGRMGGRTVISSSEERDRVYAVDSGGIRHRVTLDGSFVASARKGRDENGNTAVILSFSPDGRQQFLESTGRLTAYSELSDQRYLTVCMDGRPISEMYIAGAMSEGIISRPDGLTDKETDSLLCYINNGALPFRLQIMDYEQIDATLGSNAAAVMITAGVIAFGLICAFMILRYRLPGAVASIALLGQIAGILAAVSGFLTVFEGFTLTLPGIAGIILSIGMGVDANIITSERIAEEVRKGKTIEGAIDAGNENSFSSIFDGNVTVIIVAIILMGVFGPPDTVCSFVFKPLMWLFPASTTDAIYAFGYTLFVGVIFNFIMGVLASRIMLRSLSGFPALRSRWLYGEGER